MQRAVSGQQGPFHAILAQPAGLQAVLAFAASQFSDVVALQLTSEGLRLQAVDSAQSAFLVRAAEHEGRRTKGMCRFRLRTRSTGADSSCTSLPLQDAQFAATGSDSIFRSWLLVPPYLALHLHPKSLAALLAASNLGGALLSQLSLAVRPQSDRLSVGVSSLSKHGVPLRARYDVALLTAEGQAETLEVTAADFSFAAQLLCTLPAILVDAVASLRAAGCQEVRLTLRPGSESGKQSSSVSFESCAPELPINCELSTSWVLAAGVKCEEQAACCLGQLFAGRASTCAECPVTFCGCWSCLMVPLPLSCPPNPYLHICAGCITLEEPSADGKLALAVDAPCSATFHFKSAPAGMM